MDLTMSTGRKFNELDCQKQISQLRLCGSRKSPAVGCIDAVSAEVRHRLSFKRSQAIAILAPQILLAERAAAPE
jgi:hypothetical protein